MAADSLVNLDYSRKSDSPLEAILKSSSVAFTNARGALVGPEHADAATTQGNLAPFARVKGLIPGGRLNTPVGDRVSYDSSDGPEKRTGNGVKKTSIDPACYQFDGMGVAGVSDKSSIGKWLFGTDDEDTQVAEPDDFPSLPQGVLIEHHDGTAGVVLEFGLLEQILLSAKGGIRDLKHIASLDWALVGNGDAITNLPWKYGHCKIKKVHYVSTAAPVGSGGTAVFNVEIGAAVVSATGVTVATGGAGGTQGAVQSKDADGDEAYLHDGDTLSVTVASVGGTRTSGKVDIYVDVEYQPGF